MRLPRLQDLFDHILPPAALRIVLAAASGLLTFVATTGGLFIVVPWAQSAIVAGIAVGLVAPRIRASALTGALVGLAGVLAGPANTYAFHFSSEPWAQGPTPLIGSILVCAGVAAAVTSATRRRRIAGTAFLVVAFVLLIGNLWYTTLTMNAVISSDFGGSPLPPFNEQLKGNIPEALANQDSVLFLRVSEGMRRGADFYPGYARIFRSAPNRGAAASILDFRVPTLFWLWSILPNASWIVVTFLALASLAIAAVAPIGMASVRASLVLPGAAALTSYLLCFPVSTALFRQEGWAGALGVLALAAWALSVRSHRWRWWTAGAVCLAVLAVLTREVMAFLLVAGLVSSFVGEKSQRRFRVGTWVVGLLAFAALYGAHMVAAQPYIVTAGGIPRAGEGSVAFMLAALHYSTDFLGYQSWLAAALAAFGIVGVISVRDPRVRAYAVIATLAPLVSFLVLGNNARTLSPSGETLYTNYWGACVVPLLYALVPCALSIIPGASRRTHSAHPPS